MSSSQSSQFPPKSIVKNKSYEGVEALRQIASTSLFLDNEQKVNGQTIPTIKEPEEGSLMLCGIEERSFITSIVSDSSKDASAETAVETATSLISWKRLHIMSEA